MDDRDQASDRRAIARYYHRFATVYGDGEFFGARRASAACSAAGLRPETRPAAFCVDWPALEEWIHIRWLTTFAAPQRILARMLLPALRRRAAGRSVQLEETVLVATKV